MAHLLSYLPLAIKQNIKEKKGLKLVVVRHYRMFLSIDLFNVQNQFVTQNNVSRDRHRFVINPSEFSSSSASSNVSDDSKRFNIQNHLIILNF